MEFLMIFLPVVIFILLIIVLVMGIILMGRALRTFAKFEALIDDINEKVQTLNSFFQVFDYAVDKITSITDRVSSVMGFLGNGFLFGRKKKKKEEEE